MDFRKHFMVAPGKKVNLSKHDPGFTGDYQDKAQAKKELDETSAKLITLQNAFYADSRNALLVVLQAMDTGGKDGTIRHVFSGVNPEGCRVTAFKAPSQDELAHDFLWRIHAAVPPKGYIGIFNRSHYEDVLIVRVHNLVPKEVWSRRYDQINEFENILTENNVTVLKFFLHISKDEQKKRLDSRRNEPEKNWKFNPDDLKERKHWEDYTKAYEDALSRCSTKAAPWFVIPANHKWFRNLAVANIVTQTIANLKPRFPTPKKT
jgi:PPK2 family polyphosphate:nucleotide phosphotransferase